VGRASVEKVSSQTVNEVADRCDESAALVFVQDSEILTPFTYHGKKKTIEIRGLLRGRCKLS